MPGDKEVLVKVHAATVNRTDCAILMAKPFIMRFVTGLLKPKSPITGTDFAGIVEAVGKSVTKFKVGDRVFGFDDMGLQSHARYMTIAERKALAEIPDTISYEQAAASLEAAHYAYNFIAKVKLKAGDRALVNGATGGIGSALVQFLKYFDVHVTAVGNTKNVEVLKSLGSDRVVNYEQEDFTSNMERYALILDAVGKSSFGKCKSILQPKGIYISSELGAWSQNIFLALITPVLGGKKVIFPVPTNIPASISFVKDLLEKGKFLPVIDRTYPIEKIKEAYTYVTSGQKTGNVILRME